MSSCPTFFCDPLEDKIFSKYIMSLRVEVSLFVLCLVAQLKLAQKDTLNAIHNVPTIIQKFHTVFFLRL
jgi:hypothetical protein